MVGLLWGPGGGRVGGYGALRELERIVCGSVGGPGGRGARVLLGVLALVPESVDGSFTCRRGLVCGYIYKYAK